MSSTCKKKVYIYQNSNAKLMARLRGIDGSVMLKADFGTLEIEIFDSADETLTHDEVIDHNVAITDALVNDEGWNEDDIGYNFSYITPPTAAPEGNKTYIVQLKITDADGNVGWDGWELITSKLLISTS